MPKTCGSQNLNSPAHDWAKNWEFSRLFPYFEKLLVSPHRSSPEVIIWTCNMYSAKTHHSLVFGVVIYLYHYFVECRTGHARVVCSLHMFNSLLELYIVLIKLCVNVYFWHSETPRVHQGDTSPLPYGHSLPLPPPPALNGHICNKGTLLGCQYL